MNIVLEVICKLCVPKRVEQSQENMLKINLKNLQYQFNFFLNTQEIKVN